MSLHKTSDKEEIQTLKSEEQNKYICGIWIIVFAHSLKFNSKHSTKSEQFSIIFAFFFCIEIIDDTYHIYFDILI